MINDDTLQKILREIDTKGITNDSLAVGLFREAVDVFGAANAMRIIEPTLTSGTCPSWASAKSQSDWLAMMQNNRADGIDRYRESMARIKNTIVEIGVQILVALV